MKKASNFAITLIKERKTYLALCIMGLFLEKSNHLYLDNYFTSVKLPIIQLESDIYIYIYIYIYITGTFHKNRKGIRVTLKNLPVEKRKHKCIMILKNIYLTKFNSNKETY